MGILQHVQIDLQPYCITVERHYGSAVEGTGETTVFVGPSTMFHPHIASALDFGNDNPTDVAFVGEEDWGDVDHTILALSDVVLHEAGHTFGLFHVNTEQNGVLYPETMGLRYSSPQSEWIQDTSFLDRTFEEYDDHGGGRGAQNAHDVMMSNFHSSTTHLSRVHDSVLEELLPVYQPPTVASPELEPAAQPREDNALSQLGRFARSQPVSEFALQSTRANNADLLNVRPGLQYQARAVVEDNISNDHDEKTAGTSSTDEFAERIDAVMALGF